MSLPKPRPGVLDVAPYVGGLHTVDGVAHVIVLASNETPIGPSPHAVRAYQAASRALHRYPEIRTWVTECQPTITPHRLDTGTSGALLVARTGSGYERWRSHFSRGEVQKRYLAWCWGSPPRPRPQATR